MKTQFRIVQVLLFTCGLYACGQKQPSTENKEADQRAADRRDWNYTDSIVMKKLQGAWLFHQKQPCTKMGIKGGGAYEITMRLEIYGDQYTMYFGEQGAEPTKKCEGKFGFFRYVDRPLRTDKGWNSRMIVIEECPKLSNSLEFDLGTECLRWHQVPNGDNSGDCVFKGCLEKVQGQ
jgi:hypothetical protein